MTSSSGGTMKKTAIDGAAATPPPSPSIAASPYWAPPTRDAVKPSQGQGFSPFVAFCFTINYILGTGFLTIPWAFVQGGLALSTLLLLVVCVFADMAKDYFLEAMARAEAMLDERMRWVKDGDGGGGEGIPLVYSPMLPGPTIGRVGVDVDVDNLEGAPLSTTKTGKMDYKSLESEGVVPVITRGYGSQSSFPRSRPSSMPATPDESRHGATTPGEARRAAAGRVAGRQLMVMKPHKYLVKQRKFEINALCRVFLGRRGKDVYMLFLSLYLYCALWAYTVVFASATARQFPLRFLFDADGDDDSGRDVESASYVCYAVAFACVVVPMSCLELHEQVAAQVFLTMCRFVMVFLMVWTSSDCAHEQRLNNLMNGIDASDSHGSSVPMFRPSGIHKMLPIIVFAMIYHHSIPGLAHPVADKKKLSPIFISTTVFCALAYSLIGIVLGYAFGADIEQSANLNWASYTGAAMMADGGSVEAGTAWWAKLIKLYIILFPAIDVLSAYPLNAITLGNNMLSAFYGRRIHDVENNRWVRIPFRLLASIPPVILAVLVRQLGTITDYAGTTGFVLAFSFSALLYVCSRRAAEKRNFSQETYYTSYASSYFLACVLFVFGVGMLMFCAVLYVMDSSEEL